MQFKTSLVAACAVALAVSGCATNDLGQKRDLNNTEIGAILGTLGGAVIGAAVSSKKDRSKGALIGAIGGGLAGAGIGQYMDRQARDFQRQLATQIRDGQIFVVKRADNSILVTMTSQTAFDTNSASLKPAFMPTINTISRIVNQYGKTTLDITGHTDSTGNDRINVPLSQNRAAAVQNALLSRNVHPQRLSAYGMGASQPRASNASEAGRQLNRRVEILIEPVAAG
ncbi:OmpA family protein [Laribacter hongkongensis]|uniref:OmpA family protein n=1 Tax=Laribacter hongkongensis TaxID=168471 RepID=UPI001EFCDAAC|nr:OmpA family protein [Laribacter hongkongensis]MCG9094194.1 OmpA family protein [Laribacter hongkongensis]